MPPKLGNSNTGKVVINITTVGGSISEALRKLATGHRARLLPRHPSAKLLFGFHRRKTGKGENIARTEALADNAIRGLGDLHAPSAMSRESSP